MFVDVLNDCLYMSWHDAFMAYLVNLSVQVSARKYCVSGEGGSKKSFANVFDHHLSLKIISPLPISPSQTGFLIHIHLRWQSTL